MDDPLSRALSESTSDPPPAAVNTRPIGETLATLRRQILSVLNEHFFDAGVFDEAVPLLHHTLIDTGSIHIVARRAEPAYEAAVTINVRSRRADPGDVTHEEIEACGVLRRLRETHPGEHALGIAIVQEADGTRSVDTAAFTIELAAAIRRFAEEDHRVT
jgi:hypothetical protein